LNEPERVEVDLVVRGAAEVATPIGSEPRGGRALGEIRVVERGAVAIDRGRIAAVASESEIAARYRGRRELDARGGAIVPGFVDAHTHPVFATTRELEFEMRTRGATYADIAAAGGGILSTARGVRAASLDELVRRLTLHLDRFLALGTTTVEAKSGYGLSLDDELKCLEAIARARSEHQVEVVPTFLGAHDFPAEYRERRADYVRLVVEEMLPAVAGRSLAEYCDVFVDKIAFSRDDARAICGRARALGMRVRLHVDQLSPFGGAELASELGAASADHLEHVSERGIEAMLRAGVVPVLCPVVPLYLRQEREAPGRRMIDAGLPVAIATDFNPGSCYLQSLPEVITWAALRYRMTAAECLTAATLNAACSLGRGSEIGSLEPGKRADLAILDVPSHHHLAYELGRNPVARVVARGELCA
jgi:imidazolonepropionase